MSSQESSIPPALVDKCFIPYSPDSPPSLYGVSVGPADQHPAPSICLAPESLARGVTTISEAFTSHSGSPLIDSKDSNKNILPVTVVCSPHLNSLVAVDAAVRHIAYGVEADLIILDPVDLAAGRRGVFGKELTYAFWQLYSCHYRKRKPSAKRKGESDSDVPNLSMLFDGPDLESDNLEPESPSFTAAKSLVRDFLLVHSSPERSLSRRRIVYLRDYGALCKAVLPLLPVLFDTASSGPPTIFIAGVSPIQQVVPPGDSSAESDQNIAQYNQFLDSLGGDNFVGYLGTKYSTICSEPSDFFKRCQGLEDVFTHTFLNHYQDNSLSKASRPEDIFIDPYANLTPYQSNGSQHMLSSVGRHPPPSQRTLCSVGQHMELRFTRTVRVALSQDPPDEVQEASENVHRRRLLLSNLQLVHSSAKLEGKYLAFDINHCRESINGLNSEPLAALESSVLDKERLKRVTDALPSSSQLSDVVFALTRADHALDETKRKTARLETEWLQILAKSKIQESGPTVDPILARVELHKSELNKHEQRLLSCIVDPTEIETTFEDVCVKSEIIETLQIAVMYPILFPNVFTTGILAQESMGGVLLFGPPGTGKTMACRALAKESGARMLMLTASTVRDSYIGVAEKIISAAFSLARRLGPCIIFIDELDALFCKRTGSDNNAGVIMHRAMLTEFTQEMDGLTTANANRQAKVIVVGATNRPQDIDSAVMRRLSRRILVDLPSMKQRKDIINQYMKNEKCDEKVDVEKLARRTQLFSGSDLRHLVHSAALAALKDTLPTIADVRAYIAKGDPIPEPDARVIQEKHFTQALKQVAASANRKELDELRQWANDMHQL